MEDITFLLFNYESEGDTALDILNNTPLPSKGNRCLCEIKPHGQIYSNIKLIDNLEHPEFGRFLLPIKPLDAFLLDSIPEVYDGNDFNFFGSPSESGSE